MASSSSSSSASASSLPVIGSTSANSNTDLLKEIRSHKVAIAELNDLSSFRAFYQKNGNIFFRTTAQKAKASEQRQLEAAEAKLQSLSSP